MKERSLTSDGKIVDHSSGLGTVTKEMVSKRAHEIALINGRTNNKPTTDDWDEAKRELTGAPDPGSDVSDELPAYKRWDPVPVSRGVKVNAVQPEDEQTMVESLVNEGVEEAEHEQMVEGARESAEQDREVEDEEPER